MFTSFDQNTAECYDDQILLTMICIFWPKFELTQRYVALHVTEIGFKKKNICFPLDIMQNNVVSTQIMAKI